MRSWMIAASLGIAFVSCWPRLFEAAWLALPLAAIGCCLMLRWWSGAFFVMAMLFAWAWGQGTMAGLLPFSEEGRDLVAQGHVCSQPQVGAQALSFDFCAERLLDPLTEATVLGPVKLRLAWYRDRGSDARLEPVEIRQALNLKVRLKRPRGFLNPAGFDRETWLIMNGYGATGYVRSREPGTPQSDSWTAKLAETRGQVLAKLRAHTENRVHGASLEALTLGVTERLDTESWDLLARTGTTHLLVVSGMHIGLFAGLIFALTRWLWLRSGGALWLRADVPAAVLGLLTAAAYTLLSGAGLPARRAFLMVALGLIALVALRRWRPSTVFCLALLGVLLSQPLATRAPGFWLSFGAVAAIGLGLVGRLWRRQTFWQGAWRVQWSVTLLLTPLLLAWFDLMPWLSLPVNLIAVPLVSLWVTPVALAGLLLLSLIPVVGEGLLWMADLGLRLFWWMVEWAASPQWAVQTLAVPGWWLLPLLLLGLLLIMPRGTPGRSLPLILVLLVLYPPSNRTDGLLRIRVLDVGQGLAVQASDGRHAMLYDVGPWFSERFDAGAAVVVPNLRAWGVQRLNEVVISHGDLDHAGGLASVVSRFPVDRLWSGEPSRLQVPDLYSHDFYQQCHEGMAWNWPGVHFEVLWPLQPEGLSSNNRSCVLRIQYGEWRILLTGDIEARAERELVRRLGDRLRADVLILSHHGGKYSSSFEFLRQVNPAIALASAGYRNRFGHPAKETLARLRELDIPWLNTASHGALDLTFEENKLVIASERQRRLGYWYQRPETARVEGHGEFESRVEWESQKSQGCGSRILRKRLHSDTDTYTFVIEYADIEREEVACLSSSKPAAG